MNLLQACEDPELFAPWFRNPATWAAWFAFIAALFALPMTPEQLAMYQKHTGRQEPPEMPSNEAWLVIGRRGGKSFIMALIAVFLACFRDYRRFLQPGERATIAVVAADRRQARIIIRYVGGLLTNIPLLSEMIEREVADGFDLAGSVTIEVTTASGRTSRGYTFAAVLADEIAFWPNNEASAQPDVDVLDALRPGMATIPGAMLLCASSPYSRRGELWNAFRQWWGKAQAPLVWRAATRDMNPGIAQAVVDHAMQRDEASARAEWLAEFRSDLEALLTREGVSAVVEAGTVVRPRRSGVRYVGFVDPSGGSSDAMTLAIAHREGDVAVLDVAAERRPPFSPEAVVSEFAAVLKGYGISEVSGDRYAGEWPREAFRRHGISYRVADANRSELYLALVPAVNSGRVNLLDLPRLENQLVALERRTTRLGRDLVDHPPGGHDDVANAVAGAVHLTIGKRVPVSAAGLVGARSAFARASSYSGRVASHG